MAESVHPVTPNPATATPPPGALPPSPLLWTGAALRECDYRMALDPQCLAELAEAAAALRKAPLPLLLLSEDMFPLQNCRALMAEVRRRLDEVAGLVMLGRLPLEDLTAEEAAACYWLLGRLLGRPVAQNWRGALIYDVHDSGRPHGGGVRGDVTNVELSFHTDNSYGATPPDYVALLCLQPGLTGGDSRVVSWHAVYNALHRAHPALARRGFAPFPFDRQTEHAPGAPRVLSRPLFSWEPDERRLRVCYSGHLIRAGYRMTGQAPDPEGAALLEALEAVLADPALPVAFGFRRGEMQFLNNGAVGHARTAFTDAPQPERRRRLVRLWFRERGRLSYDG